MPIVNCVADLRELARRRVPRALFEYADRGSYDEITLKRNRADLDALAFRQRVMVDVSRQSLSTTMMGQAATMPVGIAPTGLAGLYCADGEILGARAAQAFGIPFCLSTMSICSIEDVRQATSEPFWFQIYLTRTRSFNLELIERARLAQCPVLVLTVDLPVMGLRRRDAKNGLTVPPRLTRRNLLDVATKPAWALRILLGRRRTFGNLEDFMKRSKLSLTTAASWVAAQFDPTVTWADIAWIRTVWPRKLLLKGILDPEDARRACDMGVDGLIVSNHGGRQLDGAPSTISVLPAIVDAVDGDCEVLMDGGVQCGQDVLKALALGARGCLIGKAFLYGLGGMGERGVAAVLNIIRDELQVSLALTGNGDVNSVSSAILRRPGDCPSGRAG
jgi:L-lactate dehydrogenase (cytochrome)